MRHKASSFAGQTASGPLLPALFDKKSPNTAFPVPCKSIE
jgi:hypothetical protein